MNLNWQHFLSSHQAHFNSETDISFISASISSPKSLYPIAHLGILSISGTDAAKLLQGQITCNVNDITETKSSLGALCNPKGRVLSTFLLIKTPSAFLMILPIDLLDSIQKRLRMYILRSDVTIDNATETLCLFGLKDQTHSNNNERFFTDQSSYIRVNFSSTLNRQLIIADPDTATQLWAEYTTQESFTPSHSVEWQYLDLLDGIPWLSLATAEEFIPQMLNLDELGGISYTKGCYTGQEIVARTHYLGKSKRELVLAECQSSHTPAPNSSIYALDSDSDQGIAKVVLALPAPHLATDQNKPDLIKQTLLIVLHVQENTPTQLIIKTEPLTPVTLLTEQP